MGHRQGQLQHGQLRQGGGIQDHQIAGAAGAIPHQAEHPAVILRAGTGAGHHHRLTHETAGGGAPQLALAAGQVQLLEGLQGGVALLGFGHRHPAEAGLQAHLARIHHGELAGARFQQLTAGRAGGQVDAAAHQLTGGDGVEVHGAEIHPRGDGGEIGVENRIHHQLTGGRILKGIEVVEHKALGGRDLQRLAAGLGATLTGNQPELARLARLGAQALGRSLLAQHKAGGVEGHGVLQEHRPVGGDGEVVQEGEALETVGAIGQQLAGLGPLAGELHQADRAAGASLHAEGDHAGLTVMTGVEAGMGTEGLAGLEQAIEA